jgi:flavin reductase (DIM6/NTAB) family NADH-FMN oxidoreductase RutF
MTMATAAKCVIAMTVAWASPGNAMLVPLQTPPVLSSPVFSLATINADGSTNMNILTYATPVSIRPVRRWAIALFRQSESHANFVARRSGVLQLLSTTHAHHQLVNTLGGSSARDVDKGALCAELGFPWVDEPRFSTKLLPRCVAYYNLAGEGELINAGEHDVAICQVVSILGTGDSLGDDGAVCALDTARLRDLGMISEAGRAVPP